MHTKWLDAYFESHDDRANRSMWIHRAALDFASPIIKDMGTEVPSEDVSEKGLLLRRRKALNGGKVPRLNRFAANGYDDIQQPRTREALCRNVIFLTS
jgi:hypothetical protein